MQKCMGMAIRSQQMLFILYTVKFPEKVKRKFERDYFFHFISFSKILLDLFVTKIEENKYIFKYLLVCLHIL